MFSSSLSIAFMTLCLNLILPLHLCRSKHSSAYFLLFRLDKILVPIGFMLQSKPQQRVKLCINMAFHSIFIVLSFHTKQYQSPLHQNLETRRFKSGQNKHGYFFAFSYAVKCKRLKVVCAVQNATLQRQVDRIPKHFYHLVYREAFSYSCVFILIFIFIHIHSYSPKGDKFTHPMLIAFLLTIFNPKVFWSLVMRLGS